MNEIKIDKKYPMPTSVKEGRRKTKYPWHDLEVGDSFTIEATYSAHPAVAYANKKYAPKAFKTARDKDGKLRIWRVK
jgi:hypothetical protein